jgi:hypothetical protein
MTPTLNARIISCITTQRAPHCIVPNMSLYRNEGKKPQQQQQQQKPQQKGSQPQQHQQQKKHKQQK